MDLGELMGGILGTTIIVSIVIGVVTIAIVLIVTRRIRGMMGGSGGGFMPPNMMQDGIAAQAQIVQIQQTNTLVNHNPVAVLDLNVQPPNGQPYQTRVRRVIPMLQIMQFQPGAVVPVMIDRNNPQNVVITL
jgi:hypothetical protein